jgi:hypothetical protein
METERIFSAEQIEVHPELAGIIKDYTKAVIKGNPDDILEFSWQYFKEKAEADSSAAAGGGGKDQALFSSLRVMMFFSPYCQRYVMCYVEKK